MTLLRTWSSGQVLSARHSLTVELMRSSPLVAWFILFRHTASLVTVWTLSPSVSIVSMMTPSNPSLTFTQRLTQVRILSIILKTLTF